MDFLIELSMVVLIISLANLVNSMRKAIERKY